MRWLRSGLGSRLCFGMPVIALAIGVGSVALRIGEGGMGPEPALAADPEHLAACPACRQMREIDAHAPR